MVTCFVFCCCFFLNYEGVTSLPTYLVSCPYCWASFVLEVPENRVKGTIIFAFVKARIFYTFFTQLPLNAKYFEWFIIIQTRDPSFLSIYHVVTTTLSLNDVCNARMCNSNRVFIEYLQVKALTFVCHSLHRFNYALGIRTRNWGIKIYWNQMFNSQMRNVAKRQLMKPDTLLPNQVKGHVHIS